MTHEAAAPRLRLEPSREDSRQTLLYGVVFVVIAGLVLAPILFLIVNSFQLAPPGHAPVWGLRSWQLALGTRDTWMAISSRWSRYCPCFRSASISPPA